MFIFLLSSILWIILWPLSQIFLANSCVRPDPPSPPPPQVVNSGLNYCNTLNIIYRVSTVLCVMYVKSVLILCCVNTTLTRYNIVTAGGINLLSFLYLAKQAWSQGLLIIYVTQIPPQIAFMWPFCISLPEQIICQSSDDFKYIKGVCVCFVFKVWLYSWCLWCSVYLFIWLNHL